MNAPRFIAGLLLFGSTALAQTNVFLSPAVAGLQQQPDLIAQTHAIPTEARKIERACALYERCFALGGGEKLPDKDTILGIKLRPILALIKAGRYAEADKELTKVEQFAEKLHRKN